MHHTVREFFLSPHNSLTRSPFHAADIQEALKMIRLTCVRYLTLHYKELMLNFPNTVDDWTWGSDEVCKFLQYLNKRPFVRYALEYLTRSQGDVDTDPKTAQFHSDLINTVHNSPPSPALVLLTQLTDFGMHSSSIQVSLNHLLSVAAKNGYVFAVGNLVAAGAACNSFDRHQHTPLHLAALNGHAATVQVLLDSGADIEAFQNSSHTPLHLAALSGHEATVRLLLNRGAQIEATQHSNRTPLHLAVLNGHKSTVCQLLEHGANIEAKFDGNR